VSGMVWAEVSAGRWTVVVRRATNKGFARRSAEFLEWEEGCKQCWGVSSAVSREGCVVRQIKVPTGAPQSSWSEWNGVSRVVSRGVSRGVDSGSASCDK